MSCLLCNSDRSTKVSSTDRHGDVLETCVCDGCGLVYNSPIPNDEELRNFYANDYRKDYKGSFQPRSRQIIRNFRRVSAHLDQYSDMFSEAKNILDVGAGSGEFVFALGNAKKNIQGIEPNVDYADYCRSKLGINVATMDLREAEFGKKEFDFINLSHVLEHLNDPVHYLKLLGEWLSDDGILYVEVPNIFSYTQHKSKGNMFHYGHIFNFSPWTLRAAGGRAGFVECSASARRGKDKTGVFFKKIKKPTPMKNAQNQANATAVKKAVEAHMVNGASIAKRSKFIGKNLTRINETYSSYRLGSPQNIGKFVLKNLALG